jgi:hypothetical protein
MDIAAFKVSHSTDIDATALRAARASSSSIHRGDGCKFRDSSRCTPTKEAVLSWILQPSKFATPPEATPTPPPCKPRKQGQPPQGRWINVQGKFKMKAHIISSVVMDVTAFKGSHSVVDDKDATALRAARARSSSIHRGDGGSIPEGSKSEHTCSCDSFSYTFELISVAVPWM